MQSDQQLVTEHQDWIQQAVENNALKGNAKWSESVAVGNAKFIERLQQQLGIQVASRRNIAAGDVHLLQKPETAYQALFEGEKGRLSVDNGVYFNENDDKSVD